MPLIVSLTEKSGRHLIDVWPLGTRAERAMYQKLKDTYRKGALFAVSQDSREELDWPASRTEILGKRVHEICSARIAALRMP